MKMQTKNGEKKFFSLAMYPYIIKKYNSLFEDLLKEYQMTQVEIDVLAFLANNPEYNHAQDIVNVRGISKGHVSLAIEKLVKRGYLTRNPDPQNRRCNILCVEHQADSLIKRIQDIQHQFDDMSFQNISSSDSIFYHQILQKIYQNLGGGHNE